MELVNVKISGTVVSARYGTLTAGDVLRTDAEYARHLVDECGAATYAAKPEKAKQPEEPAEAPAEAKPKRKG